MDKMDQICYLYVWSEIIVHTTVNYSEHAHSRGELSEIWSFYAPASEYYFSPQTMIPSTPGWKAVADSINFELFISP